MVGLLNFSAPTLKLTNPKLEPRIPTPLTFSKLLPPDYNQDIF